MSSEHPAGAPSSELDLVALPRLRGAPQVEAQSLAAEQTPVESRVIALRVRPPPRWRRLAAAPSRRTQAIAAPHAASGTELDPRLVIILTDVLARAAAT